MLSRIRAVGAAAVAPVTTRLSNRAQASAFAVASLGILAAYLALGAPTDKASLLAFFSSQMVTITALVKELLG